MKDIFNSNRIELNSRWIKGTVSQDGRGYKSDIKQKVSLNPITSEAKKSCFVKGPVSQLLLKDSALYQNISFETIWFIQNYGVFPVSVIWLM